MGLRLFGTYSGVDGMLPSDVGIACFESRIRLITTRIHKPLSVSCLRECLPPRATMNILTVNLILAASALALDQAPLQLQESSSGNIPDIIRQNGTHGRPNIVFILVDDQDLQMDSLSYTPHTNHYIRDQGVFYKNHFVTTALCCPSRVSLWTGKQAHKTNVTEIYPPYGMLLGHTKDNPYAYTVV